LKRVLLGFAALVSGCATVQEPPALASGGASLGEQQAAQQSSLNSLPESRELKRKIAIGRFTNLTRYGKSLLTPGAPDPIASQAADVLSSRLAETGRFVVIDRPSILLAEQTGAVQGQEGSQLVGVDAIVVGAVTQFGRRDEGRTGFMSSTKRQVAEATVEARLVDVATGRVFFTATGSGSSTTEVGEVAGFGSRAAYDDTLNDKAIAAAIGDLMNAVVQRLSARTWSTDVLEVRPTAIIIAGGSSQGLRVGDRLSVTTESTRVVSQATGAMISLPGREVAQIVVESFFGEDVSSQGAVARVVSGSVPDTVDRKSLRVVEIQK
jgi:curli biogenesis system outer membrane secretion channel CsgG